ncbi:MAG: CDP-alcohol phosphatidyltransferase family protein, partial [Proteobacteria bacterium]
MKNSPARREVKSRSVQSFHVLSQWLVKRGLTPNQVSVMSAVFALLGALSFFAASRSLTFGTQAIFLIGALLGIQLRLLCNLIDGLMAVEGG